MNNKCKTEVVARTKAMLIQKFEEAGVKEAFDVWRKLEALESEAAVLEREVAVRRELNPEVREGHLARVILDVLIDVELGDDIDFVLH